MRTVSITLAVVFAVLAAALAAPESINIDASRLKPFPHYWERCTGSGHALLGTRSDWREHLIRARRDLGIQSVRFHGLLDDDMSVVLGPRDYSFFDIDSVFDFIQSIGVRPIVEISFMPKLLASNDGNDTIFHYQGITDPPKNYDDWSHLITTLVQHFVDRYGLAEVREWHFEVWNEPNLGFWTPPSENLRMPTYFELYNHTQAAVKAVDKLLKVGGPATAQLAWITEFLKYTNVNNVPVDFVSTHIYPSDPNVDQKVNSGLARALEKARDQVTAGKGPEFPLIVTEYNSGLWDRHDETYAAAFLVNLFSQLPPNTTQVLSYWTFSDVFEEAGMIAKPFRTGTGFGMITVTGVAKPVYRAFQLLHGAGDEIASATYSNPSADRSVTVLPLVNTRGHELRLMVSNFDVDQSPENERDVVISLANVVAPGTNTVQYYRIDANHTNPIALWQQLGSPTYPTAEQQDVMLAASELVLESMPVTSVAGEVTVSFTMAPQSFYCFFFTV